jgi:hypothetical protein
MANRLQKLALVKYTPGTPEVLPVPAYCVKVPEYLPARTGISGWIYGVVTGIGQNAGQTAYIPQYKQFPAQTIYRDICYPAVPGRKAVPAVVQYTAINGWSSGARSSEMLEADGHFAFQVGRSVGAVVVGLSRNNITTLPNEQTHALYIHDGQVDIMESGYVVASNVLEHFGSTVYRIARRGDRITYETEDWSYESSMPSQGPVALDASLYSSGDYIENPELEVYAPSGYAAGPLPALSGIGSDSSGYAFGGGSLVALRGEGAGGMLEGGSGSLQALSGWGSDQAGYGAGAGVLPALIGDGDGGFPEFQIATAQGFLSPLIGLGFGITGEIGEGAGSLGALTGWGSDRDGYAAASGTLQAVTGFGNGSIPGLSEDIISSTLVIGSSFDAPLVAADNISSQLTIGNSFTLTGLSGDDFTSALIFGGSFADEFAVVDSYRSGLLLGFRLYDQLAAEDLAGVLAAQSQQLAVNALTGAPSRYVDFDFKAFAQVGQELYALRADGLYRVRAGDDDGEKLRAMVDLGASDFGVSQVKRVESVLLGADTDATVRVRLTADSGNNVYPLKFYGPMARAITAKGASGRLWNTVLEIDGASFFDMDTIEWRVGASSRRLLRR